MSTPFRWDQPELDRICGKLKDFSTILFMVKDETELDTLWELAEKNLMPNIRNAGLQTLIYDARTQSQDILTMPQARSADVILFRHKSGNGHARNVSILQMLSQLPGAILTFSSEVSTHWNEFFDITLTFKEKVCTVTDHKTKKVFDELRDEKTSAPIKVAPEELPQIHCFNISSSLQKDIAAIIGPKEAKIVDVEKMDFTKQVPHFKGGDLLLVETTENEAGLGALFKAASMGGTPSIVLAKKIKREEDRLKLYDLGATFVVLKEASPGETLALISSILRFSNLGKVSSYFPLRQWDEDFQRMSMRVKRDLFWMENESMELREYYQALCAHVLKRSVLSSTPCGVLWVPLPDLSEAAPKGGWVNLMRKTLLQSLIATVRQRDITFVYRDNLVLISGDLSPLASTYVIKRIESQLASLGGTNSKIEKQFFPVSEKNLDEQALMLLDDLISTLDRTAKA